MTDYIIQDTQCLFCRILINSTNNNGTLYKACCAVRLKYRIWHILIKKMFFLLFAFKKNTSLRHISKTVRL